jgi:uncharacterized protein with HEPN domain
MSFGPLEYLRHIRDEAEFLAGRVVALSKAAFLQDELLRRGFVRSIEVMGEAAKQIPEDFRAAHPQVPWRVMAGMRDRLIHGYFTVDYDIVWDVAANRAAALKDAIDEILAREGEPEI